MIEEFLVNIQTIGTPQHRQGFGWRFSAGDFRGPVFADNEETK